MQDNRMHLLGAGMQFVGYTRYTPLLGGQHLARLTWRGGPGGVPRQIGLVTGHPTHAAAMTWLLAEAERVEAERVEAERREATHDARA